MLKDEMSVDLSVLLEEELNRKDIPRDLIPSDQKPSKEKTVRQGTLEVEKMKSESSEPEKISQPTRSWNPIWLAVARSRYPIGGAPGC